MALFMAQSAYTPQAWATLIHAPQARVLSADEMHAALRHAATAPNITPKPAG